MEHQYNSGGTAFSFRGEIDPRSVHRARIIHLAFIHNLDTAMIASVAAV